MKIKKRSKDRDGIAVVEFAICAPLLMLIGFGFINAGMLVQMRHNSKMLGHLAATDVFVSVDKSPAADAAIEAKYENVARQLGIVGFEVSITKTNEIARVETTISVRENSPIPLGFQTAMTISTDTFVYSPFEGGGS